MQSAQPSPELNWNSEPFGIIRTGSSTSDTAHGRGSFGSCGSSSLVHAALSAVHVPSAAHSQMLLPLLAKWARLRPKFGAVWLTFEQEQGCTQSLVFAGTQQLHLCRLGGGHGS